MKKQKVILNETYQDIYEISPDELIALIQEQKNNGVNLIKFMGDRDGDVQVQFYEQRDETDEEFKKREDNINRMQTSKGYVSDINSDLADYITTDYRKDSEFGDWLKNISNHLTP